MSHDRDLADQDVEELAEEILTLAEEGRETLADLRASSTVSPLAPALEELARRGMLRVEGERLVLTEPGRVLAERQVRRYRLAEMLFTTVLDARDEAAVNRTACVMEHVLSEGLTDSVCAFLGHPQSCPHGKPIPPGPCCRSFTETLEPLVQPLDRLAVGGSGRIVHIAARDPGRLVRLGSLGVVPGAVVHLQQKSPAAVLRVGETTLALEPGLAREIFVKREG